MTRQEFKENTALALSTLWSHKLRSFLTILGVIIGTATVISIASIITGLNAQVVERIESFGTNSAWIFKWDPGIRIGRRSREERMRKPLKYEDGVAIANSCPAVDEVSITLIKNFRGAYVKYGNEELRDAIFRGTTPTSARIWNADIQEGRYFSEAENQHHAYVVVIGLNIAETLFPHTDAIDKEIYIDGRKFRVVGVMGKRKGGFLGDNSDDKVILVPYETMKKIYPTADEHFIAILAKPGQLQRAIDQATDVLRRRRKVRFNEPNNFGISTADKIIGEFHNITGMIALVMIIISSIGLMVGGIGVMNIMLVSVVERTKEIGIRKAIGARRRDITWQFLSEAMTLTTIGGIFGMGLGWMISILIRTLAPTLPTSVPWWSVAVGFFVSAGVGLIFGLWPAMKASRLDPIVALRYE